MNASRAVLRQGHPTRATSGGPGPGAVARWWEGLRQPPARLSLALQGGGATQARSGKLRVFREHELGIDVLLASACLQKIQQPVRIDGEVYWDGGDSTNPAVFPLCCDCDSHGVLLVLPGGRLERRPRQMRFHMVDADNLASLQRTRTELPACGPFLKRLRAQGHERGAAWWSQHAASVGRQATLDLQRHFG